MTLSDGRCKGKGCRHWKPVYEVRLTAAGWDRTEKVIQDVCRCTAGVPGQREYPVFAKAGVPCSEIRHG